MHITPNHGSNSAVVGGQDLKRLFQSIGWVVSIYLSIAMAYGLWVMVVLQFRTCGLLSSCPDLPTYPSRVVNVALAFLPDIALYSILIAIGRGLAWLPNLILAVGGYQGQRFLDWFLARDVLPMVDFYAALSSILP
ncbi:hypothetical protein ABIA16_003578 [Sinorhizobium fredii]